jgi:hypothetical protein
MGRRLRLYPKRSSRNHRPIWAQKKRSEIRPAFSHAAEIFNFPAAKNRRRYFFLAAGFFLATAFLTGFFDAVDLVVFLAMRRISTRFSRMARKFFQNVADLFRHVSRNFTHREKHFA